MSDPLEHGLEPQESDVAAVGVGVDEYRAVFTTGNGRRVLTHILTEMGYFKIVQSTPEATALNNQAKRLLENCGMLKRMTGPRDAAAVKNYESIVNALFNVPMNKE